MPLSIKNLSIKYGTNPVLEDVSVIFESGTYNVLMGGNGAGKTTLIRAILGLEECQEGEIEYNNQKISNEIIAGNFGYVPQYSNIKRDFPITVEEVIQLECGLTHHICNLQPAGHLKPIGIDKLLKKRISGLSGGEMQKVLIARGLISHPKVLILDEPTNNLDRESKKFVLKLLEDLVKKENVTVIHITHDKAEVDGVEDVRIFRVRDGRLKN